MFTRLTLIVLLLSFSSTAYTFTLTKGASSTSATANTHSFLRTKLIERTRTGKILTAAGEYQVTSSTNLDDRRPMASWFITPASAEVLLKFNNKKLISIIIY